MIDPDAELSAALEESYKLSRKRTKKIKVPENVLAAMQRYYDNRKNSTTVHWDKQADLDYLFGLLHPLKNYMQAEASVGTFWIYWRTGKNTCTVTWHSEGDHRQCKVWSKQKKVDGKWVTIKEPPKIFG